MTLGWSGSGWKAGRWRVLNMGRLTPSALGENAPRTTTANTVPSQ